MPSQSANRWSTDKVVQKAKPIIGEQIKTCNYRKQQQKMKLSSVRPIVSTR
jgi:hypothetical protein